MLTGLALALMVACGSDGGGGGKAAPEPCGSETCSDREQCDESGREPVCECRAAYQGAECEACAAGYEELDGGCVPVTIDCDDNPCAVGSACVSETGKPDRCECAEFHTGPTCAQCEAGYQDNDQDGTCNEGCDNPMPEQACESPRVCDDATGSYLCSCPVGSAGENCELCEDGYARRGDAACYMTCNNEKVSCAEPQQCYDDQGRRAATCVCDLGYTGADCATCDAGFERQGESCVRSDLSGFDLLTIAGHPSGRVVAGLNSTSGVLTPIVKISNQAEGLVYDRANSTLYVANHVGIARADLGTGALTPIVSESIGHGKPLALDTRGGQLLSFRSKDYSLFAVDPSTGALTERGNPGISWLWDATYNAGSNQVIALRSQGLSPSVHAINPADGVTTELGPTTGFGPISSGTLGGVAALANGDLVVAAQRTMTADEALGAICKGLADRLGFDGYADAPYAVFAEGNVTTTLASADSSGKEIVIYESYRGPAGTSIQVQVSNPEAFICILTYEEALNLVIDANAKWAGGMVYSYRESVDAQVPPGFQADTPLALYGGSESTLGAAAALTGAFRLFSAREVQDRQLLVTSDTDSYARSNAPFQLSVFAFPSLTVKTTVALDGRLVGGLSAY